MNEVLEVDAVAVDVNVATPLCVADTVGVLLPPPAAILPVG